MKIKCRLGTTSCIINVTQNFRLIDIATQHFNSKNISVDLDEYCFKIPGYDFFLELNQTVNDLLSVAWVFTDRDPNLPTTAQEDEIIASISLIRKIERGDKIQREQLKIDPTTEASCAMYLYKRGGSLGNFATFKKRYFILQSNTLYYQETPGSEILGYIPTCCISLKLRPDIQYKDKISFDLITTSTTASARVLCADPADFSQFHQAIDDLQLRRCKAIVVTLCEELLRRDVSNMQGIFRISGQKDQVESLRFLYEAGDVPDLDMWPSEVLSSVVKMQLRNLESPLIAFGLYSEYLRLGKMSTQSPDRIETAQQCVAKLMPSQRNFLHFLCKFLKTITMYQTSNLMNAKNLAIVIGPNILRPQKETTQTAMNDNQYVLAAVQFLIEEVDLVFGQNGSQNVPDHQELALSNQRQRSSTVAANPNSYLAQEQQQIQRTRQRYSISEIDPSVTFIQDLRTAMNASQQVGKKIDALKEQHDAMMSNWNDLILAIKSNPQHSMTMSAFILSQSEVDDHFCEDGMSQMQQINANLAALVELLKPQPPPPSQPAPPPPQAPKAPQYGQYNSSSPPPPPPGKPNMSMQPPTPTSSGAHSSFNFATTPRAPAPAPPQAPQPPGAPSAPPAPQPAAFNYMDNDNYSEASDENSCPPPPPEDEDEEY